jgi:hypothetical protein
MPELFPSQAAVEVPFSNELFRILKMPRRTWTADELDQLADEMTEILRMPHGEMRLRPLQALALYELGLHRGLFGPLRVGIGKTLVSLLAPVVLFAARPLLLITADLVEKTERDRRELGRHWDLPEHQRVMTYDWLGRAQAADALEAYLPDVIVADEAHRVSNLKAAVTRRVRRFMHDHPETIMVIMSGTLTKRSLHDFAHLVGWSLPPERSFVPRNYTDLEFWADALDERKGQTKRAEPGALKVLCNEDEMKLWETDPRAAARSAFRRRMIETPGVVASYESGCDATLTINGVEKSVPRIVEEAFEILRNDWATPDGRTFADGVRMRKYALELSLDLYYVWDPPAPEYWMEARKAWHKFCRKVLSHSRSLDSEKQVAEAHDEQQELVEWQRVKKDFKPNRVAVWLDDSALEYCAAWSEKNAGIIWTQHVPFGERLAREAGLTYYGRRGLSADGRYIEDHPAGQPLVASFGSNHRGKNLHEKWSKNLVTCFPANGLQAEQLIGRTHRDGQQADEVSFDVLTVCCEHVGSVWQAVEDCRYVEQLGGSPQKILLAGLNVMTPDELAQRIGQPRWNKWWRRAA